VFIFYVVQVFFLPHRWFKNQAKTLRKPIVNHDGFQIEDESNFYGSLFSKLPGWGFYCCNGERVGKKGENNPNKPK